MNAISVNTVNGSILNDMMKKRQRRVSLYVEWTNGDGSEALVRMLTGKGARGVEIDRDVDLESYPSPRIAREHTVLRISFGPRYSVSDALIDVATYPGVFSVGEM